MHFDQVTKAINRNLAEFIVIAADTVPVTLKLRTIVIIMIIMTIIDYLTDKDDFTNDDVK